MPEADVLDSGKAIRQASASPCDHACAHCRSRYLKLAFKGHDFLAQLFALQLRIHGSRIVGEPGEHGAFIVIEVRA